MNNLVIPNDVTSDKSYEQELMSRLIEDAEFHNKTLPSGVRFVPASLIKVIDITKMFDLSNFISKSKNELLRLARKRSEFANERRNTIRQQINSIQICIAYFRVDYENKYPYDARKKIKYKDWFCTVYVDDRIIAGNLCSYQYWTEPLRKNIDNYRSYVKSQLGTELYEYDVDMDVLLDIMVRFSPKRI